MKCHVIQQQQLAFSLPFSTSYVCQQAVLFLTNNKAKILMFDILMYKKI